jgi:hypothetical protein
MSTLPDFTRMTLWFTPSQTPMLQELIEAATRAVEPGEPDPEAPRAAARRPAGGGRVIAFGALFTRSAA